MEKGVGAMSLTFRYFVYNSKNFILWLLTVLSFLYGMTTGLDFLFHFSEMLTTVAFHSFQDIFYAIVNLLIEDPSLWKSAIGLYLGAFIYGKI